jgi:cytochrome c556
MKLVILLALLGCQRDETTVEVASNPVQHEMQLLDTAMHAMLTGIARGDVRAARAAFEDVDRAKQATEAALESGRYVLARNGNRLAHFRELDEAFHADVEKMLEVAARNDVPATAEAFASVVRRCESCHAEFRK